MKSVRIACILFCLCLLIGCDGDMARSDTGDRPPVHVIYTPDPTTVPADLLENLPDPVGTPAPDPREAALLYAGERVSLYRACRDGAPGICIKEIRFGRATAWYQEFAVTKIVVRPGKDQTEAFADIRFPDKTGKETALCF